MNPFDGTKIPALVHVAGEAEIASAVLAAKAAFKTGPWSTYTGAQRAVPMLKFADLLEKNAAKLAELDTICMGAPLSTGAGLMVPQAATVFRCKLLRN